MRKNSEQLSESVDADMVLCTDLLLTSEFCKDLSVEWVGVGCGEGWKVILMTFRLFFTVLKGHDCRAI